MLPYRRDIDGLRSIAVLLVLLFHFDLGHVFEAGFFGVDIFFVISGFLIGSILRGQITAGSFNASTFYVRRIRRLAPALLATIALSFMFGWVVLTPEELEKLSTEAAAAQLYVSNVYYWKFLSYFGLQASQSPFLHTWSLAVEEQFYVFFPFLLWAVHRLGGRQTAALLSVALLSFATNLFGVHWKPEAAFYLLPTRAWEFACGALVPEVAAFARRWSVSRDRIAALGVLGILSALLIYRDDLLFPGWFAVLPVASTVALLVAGSDERTFYAKIAGTGVPVYLGRISYELYLVHWPVRVFAPLLVLNYSLVARFCCFLLCFPLSAAIYHGLGVPIRYGRLLRGRASVLAAYIFSTSLLLSFAVATKLTHGFPDRLSPEAVQLSNSANDANLSHRDCETKPIGSCQIGTPAREPTWLVYGDSHADALADAFGAFLNGHREAAYFAFHSGCMPVVQSGDVGCRDFNDGVLNFLRVHKNVKNVALISTWRQPLEPRYKNEKGEPVAGKAAVAAFYRSLERTIELHELGGRKIVVWLPVPGARKSVPSALARNILLGRSWDIRVSGKDYEKEFNFLMADLAQHPEVVLIRPARYICGTGQCAVLNDGRPLYHDEAHPAASQTEYFRRIIEREISIAQRDTMPTRTSGSPP